jgi:lipopolysaccharide transport system permease protein
MVGIIDGFRWSLLGAENVIYWPGFCASVAVVVFTMVTGLWYFRRMERTFADKI